MVQTMRVEGRQTTLVSHRELDMGSCERMEANFTGKDMSSGRTDETMENESCPEAN